MHLVIEKRIDAPRERVWPLIAVPARMSEWSLAPVRSLAPGDRGHPGTTGAMRVVSIGRPGSKRLRARLVEVIERGEPPQRVHYRLTNGYPVEAHRGEVELESQDGQTMLRWTVTARLAAGLDAPIGRRIERDLARSLDRLGACIGDLGADAPLPTLAAVEAPTPLLWSENEALLAMQRKRAAELAHAGDPQSWFARIYSLVTERLLEQARGGDIIHPAWLLRLIPIFERYYARNLAAYQSGDRAVLEPHWARAFSIAERARSPAGIGPALFHGIRAHVEGDLGRSLAEVHHQHYAADVDYSRFRADYLAMNTIFRGAAEAMFAGVPTEAIPRWFRIARKTVPAGLLDKIRDRSFYDMPRERRRAFDAGARMSQLLKNSAAS